MKFSLIDVFIVMAGVLVLVQLLPGQESQPEKPKQFIYVLRLVPRLHADANWTAEDKKVLQRHFVRFQEAIKTGQLILAGRTPESGDKTFGIAVFQAKDEAAARKFIEEDPAVAGGLMTAELHPFTVALERKNP
ncbi:MAG TPA: YciI family protein [Candidatus Udaeobacter sp.]|nr:YciI family protein [Candidatus Udaeobacter sp.]